MAERKSAEKPAAVEPLSVGAALVAVKAKVGAVRKADKNEVQRFFFRGVDAVVNAVAGALIEEGVLVFPVASSSEYGTVTTSKDRAMGHVIVTVTYRWLGPAGDWIDAQVVGESFDSGDKAVPKAMSVAYRTAILQTLTLPTDERDPDADAYERTPAEPSDVDRMRTLRAKLWDEAKLRGWADPQLFSRRFVTWAGGTTISDADRELLTRCIAALQSSQLDPMPGPVPVAETVQDALPQPQDAAPTVIEGEVVS